MTKKVEEPEDIVSMGPAISEDANICFRSRRVGDEVHIEPKIAKRIPEAELDKIPEGADVYRLQHLRDNHFRVVETIRSGPAKVNNAAYRQGWESIFGQKQTVGQA